MTTTPRSQVEKTEGNTLTSLLRQMDPGTGRKSRLQNVLTCKIGDATEDTLEFITENTDLTRSKAVRVGLELVAQRIAENEESTGGGTGIQEDP